MRKSKGNGRVGELNGEARNNQAGERWSEQVAQLMHKGGLSREKARDQVIMGELRAGNADALATMLIEGHVPSPNVRFALALMLLDTDHAEAAIARQHADPASLWLPHRLVMKSRAAQPRLDRSAGAVTKSNGKASSPGKPGAVLHDLGYEAAIARLDQAVLSTDAPGPASTAKPATRARRRN
jgi:hypothetical protein